MDDYKKIDNEKIRLNFVSKTVANQYLALKKEFNSAYDHKDRVKTIMQMDMLAEESNSVALTNIVLELAKEAGLESYLLDQSNTKH